VKAYDEWWEATRKHRFLLQECDGCGLRQHPPRSVCLSCRGEDLGWRDARGDGAIDAWTTVHRSPGPGFDPPYVVARVRLSEGPVVLSHLTGRAPYRCGDAVRLAWRALPDGRNLPVFDPMED
jgi:uncharacterized OB-fold protein